MFSGAVFLLSTAFAGPSFWMRVLQAGSEAALVGGVADWFAVVALFRRPLGLPIPHTAVVTQNKDRIGEGLANFVAANILSPENARAALQAAEPARRLAAWLECEANAQALADDLIGVVSKHDARGSIAKLVRPALRNVDLRPLLASAIEALTETGFGASLLDDAIRTARTFLQRRARHLAEVAGKRRQAILRPFEPGHLETHAAWHVVQMQQHCASGPCSCFDKRGIARSRQFCVNKLLERRTRCGCDASSVRTRFFVGDKGQASHACSCAQRAVRAMERQFAPGLAPPASAKRHA